MTSGNGTKTLVRRREGRMLAGVCAGVAGYFGVDVTPVRVITVILCLLGGTGVLAYLAAWVLIPAESQANSIAQNVSKKPGARTG